MVTGPLTVIPIGWSLWSMLDKDSGDEEDVGEAEMSLALKRIEAGEGVSLLRGHQGGVAVAVLAADRIVPRLGWGQSAKTGLIMTSSS